MVIDLGDDMNSAVTYEAARVPFPGPDLLRPARHAIGRRTRGPELHGDRRRLSEADQIRAAQFRDQMTRVVLDVNDVTDYSAFLLPNPYRLIIDIHGAQYSHGCTACAGLPAGRVRPKTEAAAAPVAARAVPLPQCAGANVSTSATGRRRTTDVAALSSAGFGLLRGGDEPTDLQG